MHTSEDDPFSDIPDLTYDAEEETRRLVVNTQAQPSQIDASTLLRKHMEPGETNNGSSLTQDGSELPPGNYKRGPPIASDSSSSSFLHHEVPSPPIETGGTQVGMRLNIASAAACHAYSPKICPMNHRPEVHSCFEEEKKFEDSLSDVSVSRATGNEVTVASQGPERSFNVVSSDVDANSGVVGDEVGVLKFDDCAAHDRAKPPNVAASRIHTDSPTITRTLPALSTRENHHSAPLLSSPLLKHDDYIVNHSLPHLPRHHATIHCETEGLSRPVGTPHGVALRESLRFSSRGSLKKPATDTSSPRVPVDSGGLSLTEKDANQHRQASSRITKTTSNNNTSISTQQPPITHHSSVKSTIHKHKQTSITSPRSFGSPTHRLQPPAIVETPPVSRRQFSHLSQVPLITLSPPKQSYNYLPVTLLPTSSPGGDQYSTFLLSELSDFSVNQLDETANPTRALVRKHTQETVYENRFAWGTHLLVKALMAALSNEAEWTLIRYLELPPGSNLASTYGLRYYVPNAEVVDVSGNNLEQLHDMPACMRVLKASHNYLSDVTNFSNFIHLQELDVSNNKLKSLQPLAGMQHLQVLKADHNLIREVDTWIRHLPGLEEVNLSHNLIEGDLGFLGRNDGRHYKVRSLDLCHNKIDQIWGLSQLGELESLDVSHNRLLEFAFVYTGQKSYPLTNLKLSHNKICRVFIEVSTPDLDVLDLSNNQLAGHSFTMRYVKNLDILNLRKQTKPMNSLKPFNDQTSRVRSLLLSGNEIQRFSANYAPWQSVEHLELADCQIFEFKRAWLAVFPNVIALNLNYNSICVGLTLRFLKKLQVLLLAGNRLKDMRKTAHIARELPDLRIFDTRGNEFNYGFYDGSMVFALRLPRGGYHAEHLNVYRALWDNNIPRNPALKKDIEDPWTCSATLFNHFFEGDYTMPVSADRDVDDAYRARLLRIAQAFYMRRVVWEKMLTLWGIHLEFVDGLPWTAEWKKEQMEDLDDKITAKLREFHILDPEDPVLRARRANASY